jgi:hypothetical protein
MEIILGTIAVLAIIWALSLHLKISGMVTDYNAALEKSGQRTENATNEAAMSANDNQLLLAKIDQLEASIKDLKATAAKRVLKR